MLNALSLLLVTTGLSGVMLLVLSSLAKSEVAGIREWRQANLLAVVALLLFAARGVVPDLLSVELANALYLGTITLIFAGFRRFLGLSVPWRLLGAGALAAISGIVFFHHVVESAALRIVSVSLYHGAVCFAIGITLRAPGEPRLRYSFTFTRCAALVLGVGHAWRASFYLIDFYQPYSLLEGSAYNLAFFAIGTLALPALTLGAVMMANARLIAASIHAADHDHLTGAASRRAFVAFAERELARAERHGSALGLLLVDADHFKHINDTHGHGVGDLVLRDLVERTQQTIRKIDYCARLGGRRVRRAVARRRRPHGALGGAAAARRARARAAGGGGRGRRVVYGQHRRGHAAAGRRHHQPDGARRCGPVCGQGGRTQPR